MDDRAQRIVDTAVALAERDGYSAVRLRDVAATAQVALGTVYKRFSSKEEILIAALEQESSAFAARFGKKTPPGATPHERITNFFAALTKGLLRRPNLSRALIRSVSSGDPNVTERVASFHAVITLLVMSAIRGEPATADQQWGSKNDEEERRIAFVLQQVWFASLVGWAGGLHDSATVLKHVDIAADMIL